MNLSFQVAIRRMSLAVVEDDLVRGVPNRLPGRTKTWIARNRRQWRSLAFERWYCYRQRRGADSSKKDDDREYRWHCSRGEEESPSSWTRSCVRYPRVLWRPSTSHLCMHLPIHRCGINGRPGSRDSVRITIDTGIHCLRIFLIELPAL